MPISRETKPAGGLREQQRLNLNALIYETSLELFRSQGFEATTVQQIVTAAGISKGTFFNHFPSKDCALQEWYRRLTLSALDQTAQRNYESGRDAILAMFTALTRGASDDPALFDAKTRALSSPQLRREECQLDQKIFDFCRSQIDKDILSGRLSKTADADFLCRMIISVLTGTAHSWALAQQQLDLTETLLERITFVLDAARNHREKA